MDDKVDDAKAKLKKFVHTTGGKITVGIGAAIVLYVAYRTLSAQNAAAQVATTTPTGTTDGGTTSDGTTAGGSTGSTDTSGTTPAVPLSDQVQSWLTGAEQSAIAADPADAALIDATLADLQNGDPLTTAEQAEYQKILASYGAPPTPLGGSQDVATAPDTTDQTSAATSLGFTNPNTPVELLGGTLVDTVTGIIAAYGPNGQPGTFTPTPGLLSWVEPGGKTVYYDPNNYAYANPARPPDLPTSVAGTVTSPIAANGSSPSNANVTPPPTPAPQPAPAPAASYSHVANPAALAALPAGTNLYYIVNGQQTLISNPAALKTLPAGTAIYTKN